MNIAGIVLQVLLGVFFLLAGVTKLVGVEAQVKNFDRWKLPQSFRPVVGLAEIAGALGLLVGVFVAWVADIGAIWLAVVMLGALVTHLRIRDEAKMMLMPVVLFAVALVITVLRWHVFVSHFA